ncbi:MAG: cold shock domain-containing protein [Planctomycetaceae bacterium]|nr:cold shock domain-containing protein [Planctomycetaceae bacterium]
MPVGTVKWFDNRKGWGFIVQPDGSDLFVHYTCIVGEGFRRLDDGARVQYEVVDGPKGKQAAEVRLLDAPAPRNLAAEDSARNEAQAS